MKFVTNRNKETSFFPIRIKRKFRNLIVQPQGIPNNILEYHLINLWYVDRVPVTILMVSVIKRINLFLYSIFLMSSYIAWNIFISKLKMESMRFCLRCGAFSMTILLCPLAHKLFVYAFVCYFSIIFYLNKSSDQL